MSATGTRLLALDALRGIAALAVVVFHTYVFSDLHLRMGLSSWIDWLFRHGGLGVPIFFVLSGFVIMWSLAGQRISLAYCGRFALRRSLRLDPPYWGALALACIILRFRGTPPSIGSMAAHFVYLQNILGYTNIVSQFWTLCYEVQFYLVLAALLWFAQRAGGPGGRVLFGVMFVFSLWTYATGVNYHGWFIGLWFQFACGVATAEMLLEKSGILVWGAEIAAVLVTGIWSGRAILVVAALTALIVGLAGKFGVLATWSGGSVLQWLGRISYSLYLFHFLGSNAAKLAAARVHSQLGAWLVFAGTIGIALLAAHLAWLVLERPAHRLSRRVNMEPDAPSVRVALSSV